MKVILMVKVLAILLLTSSCSTDTFHYYKDEINELTQDPKKRKFKESNSDVNDLRECDYLVKMGNWQITKVGIQGEHKYFGRNQHWRNGTMNTETGVSLDFNSQQNSAFFAKQNLIHFVYIGPWHYSPRLRKNIRFFAYTGKDGGDILYQYESQTEENKSIPEKKFSIPQNAKTAPDKFGLCVTKWTVKYGYNAVAEIKSRNPFSKNYLVPTGRIIEVEE